MLSRYQFKEVYDLNSFQEDASNPIFFPVSDNEDFPGEIREKAEEMIDSLIAAYEKENNCALDLSKLRLNARVEVYFNQDNKPIGNISVVMVSDNSEDPDLWIENDIDIYYGDDLYEPLKKYFMQQLEKVLFVAVEND